MNDSKKEVTVKVHYLVTSNNSADSINISPEADISDIKQALKERNPGSLGKADDISIKITITKEFYSFIKKQQTNSITEEDEDEEDEEDKADKLTVASHVQAKVISDLQALFLSANPKKIKKRCLQVSYPPPQQQQAPQQQQVKLPSRTVPTPQTYTAFYKTEIVPRLLRTDLKIPDNDHASNCATCKAENTLPTPVKKNSKLVLEHQFLAKEKAEISDETSLYNPLCIYFQKLLNLIPNCSYSYENTSGNAYLEGRKPDGTLWIQKLTAKEYKNAFYVGVLFEYKAPHSHENNLFDPDSLGQIFCYLNCVLLVSPMRQFCYGVLYDGFKLQFLKSERTNGTMTYSQSQIFGHESKDAFHFLCCLTQLSPEGLGFTDNFGITSIPQKYSFFKYLGSGATSIVHEVKELSKGRSEHFVLKFFKQSSQDVVHNEKKILKIFQDQKATCNVPIIKEEGSGYFIMSPVCKPIEYDGWHFGQVKKLYQDLILVLKFCTDHSIIHRDIRPSNIGYFLPSDCYYLLDWGYSVCNTGNDFFFHIGVSHYVSNRILQKKIENSISRGGVPTVLVYQLLPDDDRESLLKSCYILYHHNEAKILHALLNDTEIHHFWAQKITSLEKFRADLIDKEIKE